MAYFEQRKNGWRAQVRRRGMPSISRTFDLKADAEAWAREIEREAQRGNISALDNAAGRTTVGEVIARYRETVLPASRNLGLPSLLRNIEEHFGSFFLANVRGVDIAAWRDRLSAEGYAPKSVIHHLNALSALFAHAERELSIPLPAGNPIRSVRKPTGARARDRRLRSSELEALLKAAEAPGTSKGLREIITLAIETSMRRGELLALDWARIDLRRRIAHLETSKNGESRTVALSTTAVKALEALTPKAGGPVFAWKTPDGFKKIWERCVARARRDHLHQTLRERLSAEGLDGAAEVRALIYKKRSPQPRTLALLDELKGTDPFLSDLHFHDLRHEATSRLFEKGLGIMEVASMTGHKSLSMLKRYTHVEAEKLAQKLG
jgi:integrase